MLNPTLHSWTIENLSRMLLTLMRTGKLALKIEQDHDSIKISVTDSGNGIQKKQFKRVFEPGFTKKRGWD
jgi:signal transduction histidine kinase